MCFDVWSKRKFPLEAILLNVPKWMRPLVLSAYVCAFVRRRFHYSLSESNILAKFEVVHWNALSATKVEIKWIEKEEKDTNEMKKTAPTAMKSCVVFRWARHTQTRIHPHTERKSMRASKPIDRTTNKQPFARQTLAFSVRFPSSLSPSSSCSSSSTTAMNFRWICISAIIWTHYSHSYAREREREWVCLDVFVYSEPRMSCEIARLSRLAKNIDDGVGDEDIDVIVDAIEMNFICLFRVFSYSRVRAFESTCEYFGLYHVANIHHQFSAIFSVSSFVRCCCSRCLDGKWCVPHTVNPRERGGARATQTMLTKQRTLNVHTSFHSPTIVILLISYSHSIDLNAICKFAGSHCVSHLAIAHSPSHWVAFHTRNRRRRRRQSSIAYCVRSSFAGFAIHWRCLGYDICLVHHLRPFFFLRIFRSSVEFLCRRRRRLLLSLLWMSLSLSFLFSSCCHCFESSCRLRCSHIFLSFSFRLCVTIEIPFLFYLHSVKMTTLFPTSVSIWKCSVWLKTEAEAVMWASVERVLTFDCLRSSLAGLYGHVNVDLHVQTVRRHTPHNTQTNIEYGGSKSTWTKRQRKRIFRNNYNNKKNSDLLRAHIRLHKIVPTSSSPPLARLLSLCLCLQRHSYTQFMWIEEKAKCWLIRCFGPFAIDEKCICRIRVKRPYIRCCYYCHHHCCADAIRRNGR